MDFKGYKFILTSGCSYDRFASSFREPLIDGNGIKDFRGISTWESAFYTKYPEFLGIRDISKYEGNENVIMLSLGNGGFGNEWVSQSLIYYIKYLQKNGVNSENIYALVSFTSIHRTSVKYPSDKFKYILPEKNLLRQIPLQLYTSTYFTNKNDREVAYYLANNSPVGRLYHYTGIGRIGSELMINPIISIEHNKGNKVDYSNTYKESIRELQNKIVTNRPSIEKLDLTLKSIEDLGNFLQNNNISYNFCSMYSFFDYYPSSTSGQDPLGMQELLSIYNYSEEKKAYIKAVENLDELSYARGSSLESNFPERKDRIDSIKKYNWTFYEEGGIKKGGIDEFAQDKFGTKGYASRDRILLSQSLPRPQNHPINTLYPIIFDYFAKDCTFLKVPQTYIETANKLLDFFHYGRTGIDTGYSIDQPILPYEVFTEEIDEFTEIRNLIKTKWI